MMEARKAEAPFQATPTETPPDKQLCLTVDNCAVTLNFSSIKQNSVMTEVKRMILSGTAHAKL